MKLSMQQFTTARTHSMVHKVMDFNATLQSICRRNNPASPLSNQNNAMTDILKMKTRSSATAKSTARPSCLVGVLYGISQEKICWWLLRNWPWKLL